MKKVLLATAVALALAACGDKNMGTSPVGNTANTVTNSAANTAAKTEAVIDDTAITAAVKLKIAGDSNLSVFKISVDTKGGVVMLTGSAPTPLAVASATTLAQSVDNVRSVTNNMVVDAAATPLVSETTKNNAEASVARVGDKVADATTTGEIKAKILADDELKVLRINVDTENGQVLLSGDAPTESAKSRAEMLARQVSGVTSVKNNLTIR